MLLHVWVIGVCGVVVGAFVVQFVGSELPCPLCMLQRMAMLLAAMGPMYIIRRTAIAGAESTTDFSTGFGMSILASVLGLAISGRQILLHILPGDPGYGGAVFGFHLYTWAFIVFIVILLVSGLTLAAGSVMVVGPRIGRPDVWSRITGWVLGAVIAANAVSVFFESGFNWFLPDNPTNYELIKEFLEFLETRSGADRPVQKAN
ncbi:MAG: disulfide bond formation protein B [Phycisphaera sp.]|nr:disulfide bond formation protein B [Phycisphaera sp.]